MENNNEQVDPQRICCRIVDVYDAIQRAFTDYSQGEDNTLEGLANKMHEYLKDVPAFLIGEPQ